MTLVLATLVGIQTASALRRQKCVFFNFMVVFFFAAVVVVVIVVAVVVVVNNKGSVKDNFSNRILVFFTGHRDGPKIHNYVLVIFCSYCKADSVREREREMKNVALLLYRTTLFS
jgi:uncharacterized membrane protein YqiK